MEGTQRKPTCRGLPKPKGSEGHLWRILQLTCDGPSFNFICIIHPSVACWDLFVTVGTKQDSKVVLYPELGALCSNYLPPLFPLLAYDGLECRLCFQFFPLRSQNYLGRELRKFSISEERVLNNRQTKVVLFYC